jgi:hypothetical protein
LNAIGFIRFESSDFNFSESVINFSKWVNIISVFLRLFNLSSGVSLDCGQRGNIRITFISLMCEVRKNLNRQKDSLCFSNGPKLRAYKFEWS